MRIFTAAAKFIIVLTPLPHPVPAFHGRGWSAPGTQEPSFVPPSSHPWAELIQLQMQTRHKRHCDSCCQVSFLQNRLHWKLLKGKSQDSRIRAGSRVICLWAGSLWFASHLCTAAHAQQTIALGSPWHARLSFCGHVLYAEVDHIAFKLTGKRQHTEALVQLTFLCCNCSW